MPEWGAMVSTGRQFLLDQWWVATIPGIAIFVVSLGFNLLGDGLRDVLDPKATLMAKNSAPLLEVEDLRVRFHDSSGRRRSGARRRLHARPREARHRRGIRLGQVDDRTRHPASGAAARRGASAKPFALKASTS